MNLKNMCRIMYLIHKEELSTEVFKLVWGKGGGGIVPHGAYKHIKRANYNDLTIY
jgi:hypothetical protein